MKLYKESKTYSLINNDINNNKINHCYIFYGQDDSIIENYAMSFAKQLLCKSENKPCGECSVCNKIEKNIHSDVFLFPKKDKSIKVEDSKEIVNESLIKPLEGDFKVFILNKFQNTTVSAQNKLLKTLEEPSRNVVFIITTTQLNLVLNTIKSRSKQIYIGDFDNENLNDNHLKNVQASVVNMMVSIARSNEVLVYANKLSELTTDVLDVVEQTKEIVASALMLASGVSEKFLLSSEFKSEIKIISNRFSTKALSVLFSYLEECVVMLKTNCNKNAVLESMLLKVLEVRHKWK